MTTDRTDDGALSPELEAIAAAERDGELRARQELSGDVLRHVTRAAKRKRDTDTRIRARHRPRRPARTLPSRDRRHAQVSHGTVRAILTRGTAITDNGRSGELRSADSEPGELAA